MANNNSLLTVAKTGKNDEFYTRYDDIEKEISAYIAYDENVFAGKTILLPCDDPEWSNFTIYFAQNFHRLRIKKLISTSLAADAKPSVTNYEPTLFEQSDPQYDASKTRTHGKIFILDRDVNGDGTINYKDLEWHYLEGDGDFRSPEVRRLRDEADFIVTNPPFSLYRQFFDWIMETDKKFILIGSMNSISYKWIFPRIRDNQVWVGATNFNVGMYFNVPDDFEWRDNYNAKREIDGQKVNRVPGTCWFTNVDHGRRHHVINLMTMAENCKYSRNDIVREYGYFKYENYDAIDVPIYTAIPSDYEGIMGVPISFLGKYCPEQFEIIGCAEGESGKELGLRPYDRTLRKLNRSLRDGQLFYMKDGIPTKPYARLLIRLKR